MNKFQIYKSEQFGTIRMDVNENGVNKLRELLKD